MIAINLSKKQAVGSDPKAMQKINFKGNVEQDADTTMLVNYFRYFTRNHESIVNLFFFNIISI